MLNMDQTMLTPRKLEALVAAYFGKYPGQRFGGVTTGGKPTFYGTTNMGGATQRMVEELRALGYLTEIDGYEPGETREKDSWSLTVKGYDAIITHVSGRLADLIDPKELEQRRGEREAWEAKRDELRRQHREREDAERAERIAKHEAEKLEKLHSLFCMEGEQLIPAVPICTDDELLAFAEQIASI
jgi:hypothetical protein